MSSKTKRRRSTHVAFLSLLSIMLQASLWVTSNIYILPVYDTANNIYDKYFFSASVIFANDSLSHTASTK